jgi:hypothetical protein
LFATAHAAPAFNQNSSRSNNAKAGQDTGAGEADTIIDNMRTRINDLESRLQALGLLSAQLDQELEAIAALHSEISSLSEEAARAQADAAAANEEQRTRYAEAASVFNDQVAPLLDPEVVKSVQAALASFTQA